MTIYFFSDNINFLYDQSVLLINFCYEQFIHVSTTLTF